MIYNAELLQFFQFSIMSHWYIYLVERDVYLSVGTKNGPIRCLEYHSLVWMQTIWQCKHDAWLICHAQVPMHVAYGVKCDNIIHIIVTVGPATSLNTSPASATSALSAFQPLLTEKDYGVTFFFKYGVTWHFIGHYSVGIKASHKNLINTYIQMKCLSSFRWIYIKKCNLILSLHHSKSPIPIYWPYGLLLLRVTLSTLNKNS